MLLKNAVLTCAAALALAACSTSKPAPVTTDGLRKVVGTSLVGTRGATAKDQFAIDETVAGMCGAHVWSAGECARHGRELQQP
ncbi:hypothetical protein [Nitratireductor soli]|uniref:hypothetical protein n=1 Tax=Nitratireductor soli TaxID=1670619 RepID=UPI000B3D775E